MSVLLKLRKPLPLAFQLSNPRNTYAKKDPSSVSMLGGGLKKKKAGKAGLTIEKKVLPVETDPVRLVNYVCGSNIFKTGEDVKIKPDSEYPEWLWSLRTEAPQSLEEMDPNTKEYWLKAKALALRQKQRLIKLKKF